MTARDLPIPDAIRAEVEQALALIADGASIHAAAVAVGYYADDRHNGRTSLQHWRRYPEWRDRLAIARRTAIRRRAERIAAELRAGVPLADAVAALGTSNTWYYRARRDPAVAAIFDAALARHIRPGRALPEHVFDAILADVRAGLPLAVAARRAGCGKTSLSTWRQARPGAITRRRAEMIDAARAEFAARATEEDAA